MKTPFETLQSPYIYRLAVILLLTFFYYSCSTDDSILVTTAVDESEINPPDTTWIEREIEAGEVKDIPSVYRAIRYINELPVLQEKESLQVEGKRVFYIADYTVDMTVGSAVEQSDQISYTFPLISKEEMTPDILNLVFTVSKGELVGMGVVVYYLTKEQKEALEGITPSEMEVPAGYLALDNEFRSIPFLQTEDSGGRHLSTRMAPPDHNENIDFVDGIPLDPVLIEGGSGGGPSSPSFGLPRHPTTNTGSPGMSSGNNSHGGGGSSGGATKPVTAPNTIIIDKSFKDNKCLNNLYEKMGKGDWFNRRMKEFDKEMSVADLELKAGVADKFKELKSEKGKQRQAVTLHDNSNKKATIIINTEYLNRPNLSVARTLLHEMMHAEIYRVLLENAKGYDGNNKLDFSKSDVDAAKGDFGEIIEYYEQYKKGAQHEYIAYYRSWMILSLAEYADNNDIDYDIELLEALSWEGLKGTDEWKNTPNQEDIEQTLKDFNNDKSKTNCQ